MKVCSEFFFVVTSGLKLSPVSCFGVLCLVLFGFVLMQPNGNHLPDSDSVVPGPTWNWFFGVVMLGPLCL